jgi:aquaporin Z
MEDFRKYLVEFIGTFFLVLTVGLTALLPLDGVIGAVVIGFVLMVMVYAGGYISGGHYNPAVSLAATIRGALGVKHCLFYMIVQFIAAVLASLLVVYIAGAPEGVAQAPFPLAHLIIAEFLFTFALCYVVLTTATSSETEGNSYYGLAIGSTVLVGASVTGGVLCYGAFNPAVAIGLLTLNIACAKTVLITILVNLLAGAVAAGIYKLLDNE